MTFQSRKERALSETIELDHHWDQTMNLGGPLFFSIEGKESKKLVVRAEYVDKLRISMGEGKIKVHQRLIETEKDLDAAFQVMSQNLQKKIPSLVCVLEATAP